MTGGSRPRVRRLVGLTGGIASGKTEVARMLAAKGAVVIESDVLAREVVEPGTPGLAAVVDEFGPDVLASDGSLDRKRLAREVFTDPRARARLEAIVHPLVRERAAELVEAAPPDAVVVQDIPLLVETGQADRFEVVVVVDVPEQVQLERLTRLRGMTADEAKARIRAQASREERLAVADVVLTNSGDLAELGEQVDELWRRLTADGRGDDQGDDQGDGQATGS